MSLVSGNIVVTTDKIADGAVTAVKLADDYVNVTGDTMTGELIIKTGTHTAISLHATASTDNLQYKVFDENGNQRGSLRYIPSTSELALVRRNASVALETELKLTGDGNVTVNGAAPTAINHLTRKDYVDDTTVSITGDTMTGDLEIKKALPRLNIEETGVGSTGISLYNSSSVKNGELIKNTTNNDLYLRTLAVDGGTEGFIGLRGSTGASFASVQGTAVDSLTRKDYVDEASTRTLDTYAWTTTIDSSSIPVGLSRIYSDNAASPDGSWAHALTVKSLTTRGYQLGIPDTGSGLGNSLFWRNQNTDGTLWENWERAVKVSGDTMTGDLTIDKTDANPRLTLTPSADTGFPQINLQDASGVTRGNINYSAASGAFTIRRLSNVGAVETSLLFSNEGNVLVNGTAPTATDHLTRKDYVDGRTAAGTINSAGNTVSGNTGFTVSKSQTGLYTMTHNLGTANYSCVLTANGTSPRVIAVEQFTNSVNIRVINDAGTAVDTALNFLITEF